MVIDLVIFTCEGREHLLQKTFESFKKACDSTFDKVILAIDGQVSGAVVDLIQPDLIVQSYNRRGYVHNITSALKQVNAPYFFWLEDDWIFPKQLDVTNILSILSQHPDWAEIVLSKSGPLTKQEKADPLENHFYNNVHGFSANPCFCNTQHLQTAFQLLANAPKGDKLGEDGFENFLTKHFAQLHVICAMLDPVDQFPIAHEGYLESTPRNWHMTNSLEEKTKAHLLTIPSPSMPRKVFMLAKMATAFFKLSGMQLFSDKVYELCFRIVASSKTIGKDG